MFNLLLKVISDLVVSVILEWNQLHIDMGNSTSFLQFVRPSPKSLFICHSLKGIKYEIRSQLGLSHLWLWLWIRNNCSFSSSLPPVLYRTKHPFNKIKRTDTSILNQNNSNFTKALVFGDLLNSATIGTLILLLQMLLLILF